MSLQFRDEVTPFADHTGYLRHQAHCRLRVHLGLAAGAYCR
ncbi:hypothetical protein N5C23_22115 [Stutzerimonas stutzeri]|nr:hypothetical protein [Stutzerimonas stutzeri]MDH0185839.1 hypothetical protein [Stutzerimonas stutzeri]MDH1251005.1 hypothetical protein [Stutzerimonas stutzeri]